MELQEVLLVKKVRCHLPIGVKAGLVPSMWILFRYVSLRRAGVEARIILVFCSLKKNF
jgi:hypothetical protein